MKPVKIDPLKTVMFLINNWTTSSQPVTSCNLQKVKVIPQFSVTLEPTITLLMLLAASFMLLEASFMVLETSFMMFIVQTTKCGSI
jgi:hypothetical protein